MYDTPTFITEVLPCVTYLQLFKWLLNWKSSLYNGSLYNAIFFYYIGFYNTR